MRGDLDTKDLEILLRFPVSQPMTSPVDFLTNQVLFCVRGRASVMKAALIISGVCSKVIAPGQAIIFRNVDFGFLIQTPTCRFTLSIKEWRGLVFTSDRSNFWRKHIATSSYFHFSVKSFPQRIHSATLRTDLSTFFPRALLRLLSSYNSIWRRRLGVWSKLCRRWMISWTLIATSKVLPNVGRNLSTAKLLKKKSFRRSGRTNRRYNRCAYYALFVPTECLTLWGMLLRYLRAATLRTKWSWHRAIWSTGNL